MRKYIFSLVLIMVTAGFVFVSLGTTLDAPPAQVRIVSVERGDVHKVVAICGQLGYRDEQLLFAASNGKIGRIFAVPGQRLSSNEVIVRMENTPVAARIASGITHIPAAYEIQLDQAFRNAIRAEANCTVRDIFVEEGSYVAAGTPIARTSSSEQEIRCMVSSADMQHVQKGMWAQLFSENATDLGIAYVETVGELKADPTTGLCYCEVTLHPEKYIDLPDRATVDVDVHLAGSVGVHSLPVEAITRRNTVWCVRDGKCTELPVEIVLCDEIRAWVDLPAGMQVAIGEFEEGQRVISTLEDAQ